MLTHSRTISFANPTPRAEVSMVASWYDAGMRLSGGAAVAAAPAPAMASVGALDLSNSAVMARLDAAGKEGGRWSKFSKAMEEGLARVQDPALGSDERGPPLTAASGLGWDTSLEPKNKADMVAYAKKLNPVVGFWDPLGVINEEVKPETIGWWRHAEIKHGRVAMAGFIGYCVQANGIHFPWNIQAPIAFGDVLTRDLPAISFGDISAAGGPADQWDALPTAGKVQIICVVGFLEMYGETSLALEASGQKHYVRGGKPGYYPSLNLGIGAPHPVPLNLWDPFGFTRKMSPERKEKALLAEVNNGRLAMIGLFGLLSRSKGLIVPGLDRLEITPYAGELMAPFTAKDSVLPFVDFMASQIGTLPYDAVP